MVLVRKATSNDSETIAACLFLAFPNPVVNELYIRADETFIGSKISLTNAGGKMVMSSNYQWGSYLDMGNLPAGLYYLQLQNTDGKMVNRKVVKQ